MILQGCSRVSVKPVDAVQIKAPVDSALLVPCPNAVLYPKKDTPKDVLRVNEENMLYIGQVCDQLNDLIEAVEAR